MRKLLKVQTLSIALYLAGIFIGCTYKVMRSLSVGDINFIAVSFYLALWISYVQLCYGAFDCYCAMLLYLRRRLRTSFVISKLLMPNNLFRIVDLATSNSLGACFKCGFLVSLLYLIITIILYWIGLHIIVEIENIFGVTIVKLGSQMSFLYIIVGCVVFNVFLHMLVSCFMYIYISKKKN